MGGLADGSENIRLAILDGDGTGRGHSGEYDTTPFFLLL